MCQGARKCLVPAISEESRVGADGGWVARRKHPPSAHPSRLLHEGGTPSPLDRRWYSRALTATAAPEDAIIQLLDSGPHRGRARGCGGLRPVCWLLARRSSFPPPPLWRQRCALPRCGSSSARGAVRSCQRIDKVCDPRLTVLFGRSREGRKHAFSCADLYEPTTWWSLTASSRHKHTRGWKTWGLEAVRCR